MSRALVSPNANTGLFAAAKRPTANPRHRAHPSLLVIPRDQPGDDLPCPWCYAPTLEEDSRCSGCGRTFG